MEEVMEFIAATFYTFGPAFIALLAVYGYNHYNKPAPEVSHDDRVRITTKLILTKEKIAADGREQTVTKEQITEVEIPADKVSIGQALLANQNGPTNLDYPYSDCGNNNPNKNDDNLVDEGDIDLSSPVTDADKVQSSDEEVVDVLGDSDGEQ